MSNEGYLPYPKGFATTAIHSAQEPEQWSSRSVVAPISMSVTYKQDDPEKLGNFIYSRGGNPTRRILEKVLADLECGKYGFCLSSGLGAVTTLLSLLKHGDHILSINDIFGGTHKLLTEIASKNGIIVTFAELGITNFEKALQPNTKMIWIETPTNPSLQVCDIKELAALAKRHNIILAVDNTFLTSYLQRPLTLGADIVHYSLTKFMNGHSDVIMGALITNDENIASKLKTSQNIMGIVPSPFDCYQVLRSLKTLPLRMKQHSNSSLLIAKHLENHLKIEKVNHPGLKSHLQHELSKRQTSGHSGMISFYIKGDLKSSKKFMASLKIITSAGSLGGCESLIEIPTLLSHASVPAEEKAKLGVTDNLIRLSVGLEDPEDLIADLDQALAKI